MLIAKQKEIWNKKAVKYKERNQMERKKNETIMNRARLDKSGAEDKKAIAQKSTTFSSQGHWLLPT